MTHKTRKHIRLVSLVMAVAVVGVLAGFSCAGWEQSRRCHCT